MRVRGLAASTVLLLPLTYAAGQQPVTEATSVPPSPQRAVQVVSTTTSVSDPDPVVLPSADGVKEASPPRAARWTASARGDLDIPATAVLAYQFAARTMADVEPGCRLPWTLLAAIGRIESNHGRFGGAVLGTDGLSRPLIRGIALDGRGPVARIADTDRGRLDGDQVWDRAVGPMQFLPSTWAAVGVDADGDGTRSPDDIHDAALAAAVYLCAGGGSVAAGPGIRQAVFRYNHSHSYVASVLALERAYRTGDFSVVDSEGSSLLALARVYVGGGLPATPAVATGSTRTPQSAPPATQPTPGSTTTPAPSASAPPSTPAPSAVEEPSSPAPLPGGGDPGPTTPTPTEPGEPEPGQSEPGQPEPGQPEPGQPEPTGPAPSQPEPSSPEPSSPEPSSPEPSSPEPSPSEPEPGQPEPGEPVPDEPTPSGPQPAEPTPSQAEPSAPAPGQPEPSQPEPGQPEPSEPEPSQPAPVAVLDLTGTLLECEAGWCLDDVALDFGGTAALGESAEVDYDGDQTLETVAGELAGLAGGEVTLGVEEGTSPAVVRAIGGQPYR